MDSLDIVEAVMLIEEVFEIEIPDRDARTSVVRVTLWTRLNFAFLTDDPTNKVLISSES